MKKTYGLVLKEKREPVRPVPMNLANEEGARLWLAAAKRVMTTHAKVIKALAMR